MHAMVIVKSYVRNALGSVLFGALVVWVGPVPNATVRRRFPVLTVMRRESGIAMFVKAPGPLRYVMNADVESEYVHSVA